MSAQRPQPGDRQPDSGSDHLRGPILGGLLGALGLVLLYLGIISLAESFAHAVDQLRQDALWVTLVSAGLGTQVGLYLRVRHLLRRGAAASRALTGVGTGTSTAGMVACCAHHLTDIAPLLGLTGATAFLGQYRLWFIVAGLVVNLIGVIMSLRTLRKVSAHLKRLETASCH